MMSGYLDFQIERDELSQRLGGGLPKGSIILIEGPYGSGKSLLVQRLAYGLLDNDHSVGFVSSELTTTAFARQMRSLDYPIEDPLMKRRLVYYPVFPILGDRRTPPDVLKRFREADTLNQQDVVIVDTYSRLLTDQLHAYGENGDGGPKSPEARLRHEAEETLFRLKRRAAAGTTFILTTEHQGVPEPVLNLMRDAADVFLAIDYKLVGATATRRIIVNRFLRAKNRFSDSIGYRVEPGAGLVIEIKSVA
jgi:archaeal flagellar protein FlaH